MHTARTIKHSDANARSGAVLLVVLFVCMVVAMLSMTVLVRANRQVLSGDGGATRLKLDYLAESGLVHAKTLLLHPQNADTSGEGYWQGGEGLQVEAGNDYYDLTVTRSASGSTARCTYNIESQAYRLKNGDRTARSSLSAQLRLDPCIAYWAGAAASLPNRVTINGDVYCAGALSSAATVQGDVFADGFTGAATGQLQSRADAGVLFPDVTCTFFSPAYNYGGLFYLPRTVAPADCNNPPDPFSPSGANPAGILYSVGPLALVGNVTINGTLVVDGDLTMQGGAVTITPAKNYPALVVNGNLTIQDTSRFTASGLVQVNTMTVASTAGNITVLGALFVRNAGVSVDSLYGGEVVVTAAPMRSAVKLYSTTMALRQWSPAGGAFFKYVKRSNNGE
ncbi:MAG: hypothetical protein IH624_01405 [Phycisphaerae bacterium]|nr:hypothetical protein [Phycisphaerae bacterium]